MTSNLPQVRYRLCVSLCIFIMVAVHESVQYILPKQQIYRQRGPTHRQAKLSLADWNSYNYREPEGPGTYAFGYDVEDSESGNTQFRQEERHPNGTVTGSYGYVDPFGHAQIVHYVADERGYRVTIESSRKKSYETQEIPQEPISMKVSKSQSYSKTKKPFYTSQNSYVNPV